MEVRVRYCECDPMGVVHHANYAVWFEMGRTEMLRSQGGNYRDLEAAGRFLVVVDLSTRFKKPARYDDELTLATHLLESTPGKASAWLRAHQRRDSPRHGNLIPGLCRQPRFASADPRRPLNGPAESART